MYPKVPEFERTQQQYLQMKKEGVRCELCFKPNYYYIRVFQKDDPADDKNCLVDNIIYEWRGPNRTVSYDFPLDD